MSGLKSSARFNETIARIAEAKPVLVLQQATQLADMAFRVVASHAPYKAPLDEQDYDKMVAAATDNQFRLFPATLEPLNQANGQIVISFIVEASTQIRDFNDDQVRSKMRVLSSNVFVDDGDNTIWRVVENGDQKYLVQSIKENFAELIGARLAKRSSQVVSSANYSGLIAANGDYIQYYNTEKGGLAFGFAVHSGDSLQVCDRTTAKLLKISPAHIVAAVQGTTIENKCSLAKYMIDQTGGQNVLAEEIAPAALNAYLDYMRTLYGNTDFFSELEKLVRARRGQPKIINTYHE